MLKSFGHPAGLGMECFEVESCPVNQMSLE
jgi:hypothetical protein